MDISQVYGGDSLTAGDLQGREFNLIISRVDVKEFEDDNKGPTQKLVIRFEGAKKALICNKTNANLIAETCGKNTDNWVGKQITLYPDRVPFQGKIVDAIRVRAPIQHATSNGQQRIASSYDGDPFSSGPSERVPGPPVVRRPSTATNTDMDDEIPF